MKRIIFFYVITSVFSGIMLISGIVALKCPLQWQHKKASYPHYEGRIALQNEQMWNYAQQVFGRMQLIMGMIHLFLETPEVIWMNKICAIWPWEDATLPAILILCVPGIGMILLGNGLTGLHLKKKFKADLS